MNKLPNLIELPVTPRQIVGLYLALEDSRITLDESQIEINDTISKILFSSLSIEEMEKINELYTAGYLFKSLLGDAHDSAE